MYLFKMQPFIKNIAQDLTENPQLTSIGSRQASVESPQTIQCVYLRNALVCPQFSALLQLHLGLHYPQWAGASGGHNTCRPPQDRVKGQKPSQGVQRCEVERLEFSKQWVGGGGKVR